MCSTSGTCGELIEQGGSLTPEATQQVMNRYATEAATDYAG